jgi:hypothetical protein
MEKLITKHQPKLGPYPSLKSWNFIHVLKNSTCRCNTLPCWDIYSAVPTIMQMLSTVSEPSTQLVTVTENGSHKSEHRVEASTFDHYEIS